MSDQTYTILTLSPGSTSTKVAVFRNEEQVFKANITHPAEELAAFAKAADQFGYRKQTILDELAAHGVALESIDAFSGYCGSMGPTVGGTFAIDQKVCDHVLGTGVNHPAILGAPLLFELAKEAGGKPAFAVNQPDTDELADVARITGYPGVYRKSHVHCLNQKEVAIRCARELGKRYEEGNFVVAHVGGGLSVACHEHGRMVDANDVLEGSGPFAPNRSGDVPAKPVAKICFGGAPEGEVMGVIGKTGGLVGLVGTDDAREVCRRIDEGDTWAELCYDAMAYQVAKAIGAFAAVLKGEVDGIALTGGVSNDPRFVSYVEERVGWIAPVKVYGGDFEMEALAAGAVRALEGEDEVMTFTGVPVWDGFDMPGAIAPVA